MDTAAKNDGGSTVRLRIEGMTCQNCVRHAREALEAVDGVASVDVRLATNDAVVRRSGVDGPKPAALIEAVRHAGYQASVVPASEGSDAAGNSWSGPLIVGVAITVFFMIGHWAFHWDSESWFRWLSLGLGSVVQFYCGRGFYVGAWIQARQGRSSMDTLVALGSSTAYLLSVVLVFSGSGRHLYFLEAASIISLISLGHWIESRVNRRAESALLALMQLAPETAMRQEADGSEAEVPVAALRLNDAVVLRPGDAIPVDGAVIDGESSVDESMLTGESMPVDKALHDRLYAGTMNLNGRLLLLVTGTGEETALARIIQVVKRAQNSRASIQRLADRVSNVFVPVAVGLALVTGLVWALMPEFARGVHASLSGYLWDASIPEAVWVAALLNMAAVLIIACPCAMGLATPAAIMVSANTAARRGILVRDGTALEKAGNIDAVIFDKTGTLTMGQPELVRFETYLGKGERPPLDEMRVAVSLARMSNHPVSRAVAAYGGDSYDVKQWRELRGLGVEGQLKVDPFQERPYLLRLGSLNWMAQLKFDLTVGASFVEEWAAQGATVLAVAVDETLMGFIAVHDRLKPGAERVVKQIKHVGWKVALISGDNYATVHAVAEKVGIAPGDVYPEASPERKLQLIEALQREGQRVAFVGDGINDAPALEQADLGIAVCRANDISRRAADLVLLRTDISAVPEAIGLARATLRKIRQNLFWAFFYNVAAIPLAALGFVSPMLCALAMGISDLVVMGNALTLYAWKPRGAAAVTEEEVDG